MNEFSKQFKSEFHSITSTSIQSRSAAAARSSLYFLADDALFIVFYVTVYIFWLDFVSRFDFVKRKIMDTVVEICSFLFIKRSGKFGIGGNFAAAAGAATTCAVC